MRSLPIRLAVLVAVGCGGAPTIGDPDGGWNTPGDRGISGPDAGEDGGLSDAGVEQPHSPYLVVDGLTVRAKVAGGVVPQG